jgi:AcrR family transcriptional regulator
MPRPAANASATGAAKAKPEAILRAATVLFSRYGFRKTSIEMIAGEAGVAKPTVYAHFADKDALFVAVCERLVAEIIASTAAAAQAHAELAERLTAMLAAKFTTVFELVDSSPHARELLASTEDNAKAVIAAADERYEQLLVAAIKAAIRGGELDLRGLGRTPKAFAAMLMQLGHGAGHHAHSAAQHRRNLAELVRALVAATRLPPPAR